MINGHHTLRYNWCLKFRTKGGLRSDGLAPVKRHDVASQKDLVCVTLLLKPLFR
jgi:hypothetical protein